MDFLDELLGDVFDRKKKRRGDAVPGDQRSYDDEHGDDHRHLGEAEGAAPQVVFCTSCGGRNPVQAVFCMHCGTKR